MIGQCMAPGCSSEWAYKLRVHVEAPKAAEDQRGYGDTVTIADGTATYCESCIGAKATELMRVLWAAKP